MSCVEEEERTKKNAENVVVGGVASDRHGERQTKTARLMRSKVLSFSQVCVK